MGFLHKHKSTESTLSAYYPLPPELRTSIRHCCLVTLRGDGYQMRIEIGLYRLAD
jgi:hypothetical protein